MGKIIKFKMHEEILEESFINSLNQKQLNQFLEIVHKFDDDYSTLENKYVELLAKYNILQIQNELLDKGVHND